MRNVATFTGLRSIFDDQSDQRIWYESRGGRTLQVTLIDFKLNFGQLLVHLQSQPTPGPPWWTPIVTTVYHSVPCGDTDVDRNIKASILSWYEYRIIPRIGDAIVLCEFRPDKSEAEGQPSTVFSSEDSLGEFWDRLDPVAADALYNHANRMGFKVNNGALTRFREKLAGTKKK